MNLIFEVSLFFKDITVVILAKERHEEHKRLIEKHILVYSSNRNKIQLNLVKQQLVKRIVSHGFGQVFVFRPTTGEVWHKAVFKVGQVSGPKPTRVRQCQKYLRLRRYSPY